MSAREMPIEERAQAFYDAVFDADLVHLMDVAEGEEQPNQHEREDGISDEDDARQRLEESAHNIDREVVYYVRLTGGGPAARLMVEVDEGGDVVDASLQFQDWFESWTDAPRQDPELVARYARLVGYYAEDAA